MNLKLWISLFLTAFQVARIKSLTLTIRCTKFNYFSFDGSGSTINFECEARNLKVLEQNETVNDIDISSIASRSRIKVVSLSISASVVYYIPSGIEEKLEGLTSLVIKYSKLREVHQFNLQPFTGLTVLSLQGNEIQVIEHELFKFNSKLKEISLEYNHIQHVTPNVFDELKQLQKIYFNFNPCVMASDFNHWEKDNITAEICQKCPPRIDDSSNWDASEDLNIETQTKNCSCSGLLAFTIIFSLILFSVPILITFYYFKMRRMTIMEMKESLVQFSIINDQI